MVPTAHTSVPVTVTVSDDRLEAFLVLPRCAIPTRGEIVCAVESSGVPLSQEVETRIDEVLRDLSEGGERGEPLEAENSVRYNLARGRPPVDAVDGEFEWEPGCDPNSSLPESDRSISYYALSTVVTVQAGETVGVIHPSKPGIYGVDVFGSVIRPRRMEGVDIDVRGGLRVTGDDPQLVLAESPGRVMKKGGRVWLEEILDLSGIDFHTGNIDSIVDVRVRGDIRPHFCVRTSRSLVVDGAIECAAIEVGGDLHVRGGIVGGESGERVVVGGNLLAHFAAGQSLTAGGDVCVLRELRGCHLWASGKLRIERGAVIGGETYAREGIEARSLGSEAGVVTRLAIGMPGTALLAVREIDEQLQAIRTSSLALREQLKTLARAAARLTHEQREQAAELLGRAHELEQESQKLNQRRTGLLESARPGGQPSVIATEAVHAGVRIAFGLREVEFRRTLKGRYRIEERNSQGGVQIVAANMITGAVMVLTSYPLDETTVLRPADALTDTTAVDDAGQEAACGEPTQSAAE